MLRGKGGRGVADLAAHPSAGTIRWGKGIGRRGRTEFLFSTRLDQRGLENPQFPEEGKGRALWDYLAARGEVLALGVDALVVVDVVLPAVLGLVHVREPSIDTCCCFGG